MRHLFTKFCENRLSGFFCVILLTTKQTNADESITSLAEVTRSGVERTPALHGVTNFPQPHPYPHILSPTPSQIRIHSSLSVIYLRSPASSNCKWLPQQPCLLQVLTAWREGKRTGLSTPRGSCKRSITTQICGSPATLQPQTSGVLVLHGCKPAGCPPTQTPCWPLNTEVIQLWRN